MADLSIDVRNINIIVAVAITALIGGIVLQISLITCVVTYFFELAW